MHNGECLTRRNKISWSEYVYIIADKNAHVIIQIMCAQEKVRIYFIYLLRDDKTQKPNNLYKFVYLQQKMVIKSFPKNSAILMVRFHLFEESSLVGIEYCTVNSQRNPSCKMSLPLLLSWVGFAAAVHDVVAAF